MDAMHPGDERHDPSRPAGLLTRLIGFARRPVMLTAAAGWGGRIVAAIAQLAALRVLTQTLGVDGYGAFAVMTGLLAWYMLADFGFGAALQNEISGLRVAGRNAGATIASVTLLLFLAMAALSLIAIAVAAWAGPALLGEFGTVPAREAALAFAVYSVVALGSGVAAIAVKITFAEHRGYLAHAMTSAAAVLGVLGLVAFSPYFGSHRLAWSLTVYQAPAWIIPMAFMARRIVRMRAHGDIHALAIDWHLLSPLWVQARRFSVLYVLAALVNNVDYLILSQTVSPDRVAVYAIFSKIFALAFTIVNSVISAYWPVSAEMVHRRDMSGVGRVVIGCVGLGTLVIVGGAGMLWLLSRPIGHLLAPSGDLVLPIALIPFFVLYWVVRVWSDTYAMLVVSASKADVLSIIAAPQALLSISLGYLGARSFGIEGLMLGMTGSFLLTTVWALPWYMRRFRIRLEAKEGS